MVANGAVFDCADCGVGHPANVPCTVDALWRSCQDLATAPKILDRLNASLSQSGLAGEERAADLVFLVIVSRFFDKPLACIVKGPSSAGKSNLVDAVCRHVPPSAVYNVSSMSPAALIYGTEDLRHRVLIFAELTGADGDERQTYLLRTFLSERCLRHEVTERNAETGKFETRLVVREGPVGLIVTTTAVAWHPENETRCLSVQVDDSPEQTKRVLQALALQQAVDPPDVSAWTAFGKWLATGEHRVAVPYAPVLADLIPPVAVSLRRGFVMLMNLIAAHALTHRATRPRDDAGRVVAMVDDYAVVRELVADVFDAVHDVTVSEVIVDTVHAVRDLTLKGDPVSVGLVARHLHVDPSTASRRIKQALAGGWLQNLEGRDKRPFKLIVGDPLPTAQPLLPTVALLQARVSAWQHVTATDDATSPIHCAVAPDPDLPAFVTDTVAPDASDPIAERDRDQEATWLDI